MNIIKFCEKFVPYSNHSADYCAIKHYIWWIAGYFLNLIFHSIEQTREILNEF